MTRTQALSLASSGTAVLHGDHWECLLSLWLPGWGAGVDLAPSGQRRLRVPLTVPPSTGQPRNTEPSARKSAERLQGNPAPGREGARGQAPASQISLESRQRLGPPQGLRFRSWGFQNSERQAPFGF